MKRKYFGSLLAVLVLVIFGGVFSLNSVSAEAAALSTDYKCMYVGQTYTPSVSGSAANVQWSSSNSNISDVTSSGKITAVNVGSASIYATINGSRQSMKVEVVSKAAYDAVNYANNAVGCRYSQSRRMSSGYYDCGSLVWRSYASAGLYIGGKTSWAPTAASSASILNRNSKTLSYSSLSTSEMLPGDLIYTSSRSNGRYRSITHAAMYVGNGKIVEAANSRVGVVKRSYSASRIVLIARPSVVVSESLQTPQLLSAAARSNAVSNTSIQITWKKVNCAAGYYVYRKAADGSYSKIATINSGNTLTYTDSKAYAGKYTYTVRAFSGSKKSSYNKTGMTASARLAAPSSVTAEAVDQSIVVNWNTVQYATGYKVYRRTADSSTYKLIKVVAGKNKDTYKDITAKGDIKYVYAIRAYRKNTDTTSTNSDLTIFKKRVFFKEPVNETVEESTAAKPETENSGETEEQNNAPAETETATESSETTADDAEDFISDDATDVDEDAIGENEFNVPNDEDASDSQADAVTDGSRLEDEVIIEDSEIIGDENDGTDNGNDDEEEFSADEAEAAAAKKAEIVKDIRTIQYEY